MYDNKSPKKAIKESINEANLEKPAPYNDTSENNFDNEPTDETDFNDELDVATFISIMQLLW